MKPSAVSVRSQVPELGKFPRPKLFYRIQEVSKLTGLKPYVLRYWESEFKELAPAKDASDQRRYRLSDIEVVLAIRKLLYEDRFTIEGARKRLRDELRRVRGEEAEAPAQHAGPAAPAAPRQARRTSEKMALEEFIPAPVRESAQRAQAEARRSQAQELETARRTATTRSLRRPVLCDVEAATLAPELPGLAPLAPEDAAAAEIFAAPRRASAAIVSISPPRKADPHKVAGQLATAHAEGRAREEYDQQHLERSLSGLRREVAELLAMLT